MTLESVDLGCVEIGLQMWLQDSTQRMLDQTHQGLSCMGYMVLTRLPRLKYVLATWVRHS